MAKAIDTVHKPLTGTAAWLGAGAPRPADGPGRRRALRVIKIALPLLAVALLGAVISGPGLFNKPGSHVALKFSDLPTVAGDELRMTRPRFTGADADNRAYAVTADSATQSLADREQITLSGLEAEIDTGGAWLSISASRGEIHTARQTLQLSGTVDAYSDLGYEFHGSEAWLDLAAGTMQSGRPLRAQGEFGWLRADSMRAEDRGQSVSFSGNVRVVIYPRPGGAS